jgi:hypothetical protein
MAATDDVPTPEIKPGYLTTEFWTTLAGLVGNVIVVLTIVGRLTPEQAKQLNAAFSDLYTTIPVLLTNTWILWHYISSRTSLKQAVAATELQRQLVLMQSATIAETKSKG